MDDGPNFDFSGYDCQARTTPQATALFFDRGSSSRRESAGFNTIANVHVEARNMTDCIDQMDVFSEIRQILHNTSAAGQMGGDMNVPGQARSISFDAIDLTQLQHTPSPGSGLPRLPESLPPQNALPAFTHQAALQRDCQEQQDAFIASVLGRITNVSLKLDEALAVMVQRDLDSKEREEATQAKMENACQMMQLATARMNELISAMTHRQAELEQRYYNRSLDLRLGCGAAPVEARFNWMFGHGVTPRIHGRASRSQSRFERLKVNLKKFVLWFTDDATEEELAMIWIQFDDTPRVSITGTEIKEFLLNHDDMSHLMESSIIRVLRRDDSHREPNSNAATHYVGKEWARRVVAGGSTYECEQLFHRRPKVPYNLTSCKKVVVSMDMKAEGWAALSIDLRQGKTYRIHPNLSGANPDAVLDHHIGLMRTLTVAAQSHMIKLAKTVLPMKDWEYEVALKTQHPMNGPDSGIATAFYSVTKDNQFMIVTPQTIGLAKHTFLYSLVRMSYRCTKRKLPKGKDTRELKRDRRGKFVTKGLPHMEVGEGSGSKSSEEEGSAAA